MKQESAIISSITVSSLVSGVLLRRVSTLLTRVRMTTAIPMQLVMIIDSRFGMLYLFFLKRRSRLFKRLCFFDDLLIDGIGDFKIFGIIDIHCFDFADLLHKGF